MYRLSIQEVDGSQVVELVVRIEIPLEPEPRSGRSDSRPRARRGLALVGADPGQPVAVADATPPATSGPPEHEIDPDVP